jgi:opacity protein-like surface antigen
MKPRNVVVLVAVTLLCATGAHAQSEVSPGSSVSLVAGVAASGDVTGAVLGGSFLFDASRWIGLEGEATYVDRGAGADAFTVSGGVLVNLVPSYRRVVPYAAVGGGLYRVSFDLGNRNMFGAASELFPAGSYVCPAPGTGIGVGPGPGFGPGTGVCSADVAGYWGVGRMPAFYGRRMGAIAVPGAGAWGHRSFNDPAATIGGGVRFNVSDHVMIRSDVRARLIFADGETDTMGTFAFNVGYRF